MAIIQSVTTSFTTELFTGVHVFGTDTFKMALYLNSATLDSTTTAYTATGESSGTNYSAGGVSLTGAVVSSSGTTSFVDFDDGVFTNVSITFRGGLIYNSSKSNKSVCVIDGGIDRTATSQTITAVFPAADASNALIRITAA